MSLKRELGKIDPNESVNILDSIYQNLQSHPGELEEITGGDYKALEALAAFAYRLNTMTEEEADEIILELSKRGIGDIEKVMTAQRRLGFVEGVWATSFMFKRLAESEVLEPEEIEQLRLINHEDALLNREIRQRYKDERIAQIKEGKLVSILRGFGDEVGDSQKPGSEELRSGVIVLDYWYRGSLVGVVKGRFDVGFDIYDTESEEPDRLHHLNTEPIEDFKHAQKRIEAYIENTRRS